MVPQATAFVERLAGARRRGFHVREPANAEALSAAGKPDAVYTAAP